LEVEGEFDEILQELQAEIKRLRQDRAS